MKINRIIRWWMLVLLVVIVSLNAFSVYVDPTVIEALEKNDKARVIVTIKDNSGIKFSHIENPDKKGKWIGEKTISSLTFDEEKEIKLMEG